MRYWTLATCVCTVIALRGQTILPLIYYNPPTSGCNGVAAFLDTTQNCFQGSYTMSPMGCAPSSTVSGDTIFFSICSAPCEVVLMDGWGLPCVCGLGLMMGVPERNEVARLVVSRTNDELVITSPQALTEPWCRIYGISGRTLRQDRLGSGTRWVIDIAGMERFLILELRSADGVLVGRL